MDELIQKIISWAEERNLIDGSDPKTHSLKLVSEFGELCRSIRNNEDCGDDIGDALVVLIILIHMNNYEIDKCINKKIDHDFLISGKDSKSVLIELGIYLGILSDSVIKGLIYNEEIGYLVAGLKKIAEFNGTTIQNCLTHTYQEIKDRQGIVLDGCFIKDTDESYEGALAILKARKENE